MITGLDGGVRGTTTAPERLWAEPNTQIPARFGLWTAVSAKPGPGAHLVEYVRADLALDALEALEEAAVVAWNTGMDLHLKESDSREIGAKCAAAIRALKGGGTP